MRTEYFHTLLNEWRWIDEETMEGGALMSDKVVALPGVKLSDGSVSKDVVEEIEEVLAEARNGRVAAVGIAWVTPQQVIHQITANSGMMTAHQMVAACCYLLDTAKRDVGERSV